MAIQVLEYHHGLEPQSVWRMVNSNQFAPVAMPEKSIPYVQELGDFYASSSFYTKRHSLVSYLLKYTVSGEGVLEYGDSRYTLRADDVFWIDCQKQQYYYTAPDTGHWHVLWMHFWGEACARYYELFMLQNKGSPVVSLAGDTQVQSQLKGLLASYSQRGANVMRDIQASGTISSILISCISATMQKSFNATPQLIVQARDYISQHFCEDLSLDRLSHVLGINKYYFVRLFKSSTGYTPNEYIIMERINHAKELLRSTDLTINEVADEVGFHNPGHFINLFKRSLGMTPGMYRSFWGQGQRRKLEGSV